MKTLIATVLIFALLLLGVICNALYIQFVVDRIEADLDALPSPSDPDFSTQANAIATFWRSNSNALSFTVDYSLIDRLNENFSVLVSASDAGDAPIARATVSKLRDAIGNLERVK